MATVNFESNYNFEKPEADPNPGPKKPNRIEWHFVIRFGLWCERDVGSPSRHPLMPQTILNRLTKQNSMISASEDQIVEDRANRFILHIPFTSKQGIEKVDSKQQSEQVATWNARYNDTSS
ncbi:unnamed protein product [Rotaria magnacalcarata]|uniref:Uncharacterized protein n=1 Tax=Rotaria magnacalcarata TaxID=392030 RepID=A0A819J5Q2_9BILA|nr:unnamed protein product [Rotaria magnacalcarata]CAF2088877.1 unnamed protein product [Rotaria magnacalcarata]CAF3900640.1 unnamed protein product [Rotaria magnacalcarata]CAF3927849.1 unnamed protein product [Rotaria magnacalcarata]